MLIVKFIPRISPQKTQDKTLAQSSVF